MESIALEEKMNQYKSIAYPDVSNLRLNTAVYPEISKIMLSVAIQEIKHLHLVGSLIKKLDRHLLL